MTNVTMERIHAWKEQLVRKAWDDPGFRQLLLDNPRQAIQDAFGIDIPAQFELHVEEETPTRFVLAIPPKPEDLDHRLESSVQVAW